MKYGTKNIELMLTAALITITVVAFVILVAGSLSNTPQTTLINLGIFMIFGGVLLVCIILLRIYDKLSEILKIMESRSR